MKPLKHSKASFDELLNLLVENGNKIAGSGWGVDKEGFHIQLAKPIDWAVVYEAFSIDPKEFFIYENTIATNPEAYEILHVPQKKL